MGAYDIGIYVKQKGRLVEQTHFNYAISVLFQRQISLSVNVANR